MLFVEEIKYLLNSIIKFHLLNPVGYWHNTSEIITSLRCLLFMDFSRLFLKQVWIVDQWSLEVVLKLRDDYDIQVIIVLV